MNILRSACTPPPQVDFAIKFDERGTDYQPPPPSSGETPTFVRENLNVAIHGHSFAAQYQQVPFTPTIGPPSAYGDTDATTHWSTVRTAVPRSYEREENFKPPTEKLESIYGDRVGSDKEYHGYFPPAPIGTDFRAYVGYDGGGTVPQSIHEMHRPGARFDFHSSVISTGAPNERPRTGEILDHSVKEVAAAGTAIDNLGVGFSNDIKNIFHDLTIRLQQHNAQFLAEEQNNRKESQALERELAEMRALVESQNKVAAAKDKLVDSLTQTLAKEKSKMDTLRRYGEQRVEEQIINHEKFQEHAASHMYRRRLLLRAFIGWRKLAEQTSRNRWEAACAARAEEMCCQLRERFHDAREQVTDSYNDYFNRQLEYEMERLKQEKAMLQNDKGEYETAVQQAIMRGLCSLNMEALKVLKVNNPELDLQQNQTATVNKPVNSDPPAEPVTKGLVVMMESPEIPPGTRESLTVPDPANVETIIYSSAGQPNPNRFGQRSQMPDPIFLSNRHEHNKTTSANVTKVPRKPAITSTKKKTHQN